MENLISESGFLFPGVSETLKHWCFAETLTAGKVEKTQVTKTFWRHEGIFNSSLRLH